MMGTREVVVIKHTGCGLGHLTDEDIIGKVEASLGSVDIISGGNHRLIDVRIV